MNQLFKLPSELYSEIFHYGYGTIEENHSSSVITRMFLINSFSKILKSENLIQIGNFVVKYPWVVNQIVTIDGRTYTPLIYAICEDNLQLALILLGNGADPNLISKIDYSDNYFYNPITITIGNMYRPNKVKMLRLLIKFGVDVNDQKLGEFDGTSPPLAEAMFCIHYEPEEKIPDCIDLLIKNGADTNAVYKTNNINIHPDLKNAQIYDIPSICAAINPN